MPFHIRDEETDTLVRELARREGVGLTEAVKLAVKERLEHKGEDTARRFAAMKAISDEIAKLPETGLKADKAFFDDLSGD